MKLRRTEEVGVLENKTHYFKASDFCKAIPTPAGYIN